MAQRLCVGERQRGNIWRRCIASVRHGTFLGRLHRRMLAIDEQWLHGVGLDPLRDVVGLIGVSGPYDFCR